MFQAYLGTGYLETIQNILWEPIDCCLGYEVDVIWVSWRGIHSKDLKKPCNTFWRLSIYVQDVQ